MRLLHLYLKLNELRELHDRLKDVRFDRRYNDGTKYGQLLFEEKKRIEDKIKELGEEEIKLG